MTAATAEDVETAIGRPVSSDAELRQIEWWLSGVEILIQSRLGDVSALDQDVLRYVEAEAVVAKIRRGDSRVSSETVSVDDGSLTRRFETGVQTSDISDEWWALLNPVTGSSFYSTRPGFDAVPGAPLTPDQAAALTARIVALEAAAVHTHAISDVTALQTALDGKAPIRSGINAQTGTAYTLALTDENLLVTLTNAGAITVTVPTNATVAFPVGARVDLTVLGAGMATLVGASGVTVNATPSAVTRAQHSGVSLQKVATNTWLAWGDLAG